MIPTHSPRLEPPPEEAYDIGTSNASQSDYWQRVGGHDPEGYQDYDEDEE